MMEDVATEGRPVSSEAVSHPLAPRSDPPSSPGPVAPNGDDGIAISSAASTEDSQGTAHVLAPAAPLKSSTALPLGQAAAIYGNSPALSSPVRIFGVVLVDFDHALGPKIEMSTPARLKDDEDLSKMLPFLALPDGAHARDEDYSYFHVLAPDVSPSTIFGISCNRQLASSLLVKRASDVTRSTVQKAIVVLASQPIFGPIRDKLGVITRAFFAQKDFSETEILQDFHRSLEVSLVERGRNSESAMYMGTSIRELIFKFRFRTLMLLKLLMLQRKVMFYGTQVERLCNFQYSLVSLIPNLLVNLDDAASPLLDDRAKYLGLPLNVFGGGAFFQPYLPLQQIDMLQSSSSYLVGTTNSIFQQQRDCQIDVVVNVDQGTLDFLDPKLSGLIQLTAADRKWMDELVSTVSEGYNISDPTRPPDMTFVGSDDFLRAKFEDYICSALAAIKFADFLAKGKNAAVLIANDEMSNHLSAYNESWIAAFRMSPAFIVWDRTTDAVIFDLVEPRHPCEGQTHLMQDVGIRLAQGVHDLRLDENLAPTKEALKGLAASGSTLAQNGGESVWKAVSALRADLAKRQADYRERRERERSLSSTDASVLTKDAELQAPKKEQPSPSSYSTASTHAANLANSVGSFFTSATRSKSGISGFVPKQLSLSPDLNGATRSPRTSPNESPRISSTKSAPATSGTNETHGTLSANIASFWRKTSFGSSDAPAMTESEKPTPTLTSQRFQMPSSEAFEDDPTPEASRRSSKLSEVSL